MLSNQEINHAFVKSNDVTSIQDFWFQLLADLAFVLESLEKTIDFESAAVFMCRIAVYQNKEAELIVSFTEGETLRFKSTPFFNQSTAGAILTMHFNECGVSSLLRMRELFAKTIEKNSATVKQSALKQRIYAKYEYLLNSAIGLLTWAQEFTDSTKFKHFAASCCVGAKDEVGLVSDDEARLIYRTYDKNNDAINDPIWSLQLPLMDTLLKAYAVNVWAIPGEFSVTAWVPPNSATGHAYSAVHNHTIQCSSLEEVHEETEKILRNYVEFVITP